MNNDLHTKYRPVSLDTVIGHAPQIASLRSVISKGHSHAFLFTGSAGIGKTTLARITAMELGCAEVIEIDAATNTGIDAMRNVCSTLQYKAFGGGKKAVIVDECHRLSAAAWASLLKIIEEPPEHVYWMLCTTDSGKVPKTIKTRCAEYNLKSLKTAEILEWISLIAEAEELDIEPEGLEVIAKAAEGSMRQALVSLSLCSDTKTKAEVATLLQKAQETDGIIDLCRLLVNPRGRTWQKAMEIVNNLEDEPESVRIVVLQYLSKVAMGAKSDDEAGSIVQMMSSFSTPFNQSDKKAPLIIAIAEVIYG